MAEVISGAQICGQMINIDIRFLDEVCEATLDGGSLLPLGRHRPRLGSEADLRLRVRGIRPHFNLSQFIIIVLSCFELLGEH